MKPLEDRPADLWRFDRRAERCVALVRLRVPRFVVAQEARLIWSAYHGGAWWGVAAAAWWAFQSDLDAARGLPWQLACWWLVRRGTLVWRGGLLHAAICRGDCEATGLDCMGAVLPRWAHWCANISFGRDPGAVEEPDARA